MTAQQVLNSLRDEINNLGKISTIQNGDETFSASVDGNKLIIQGNDTQRNIGIEGSESLMNLDDKVIFTRRTWKWDQITRIFHSTRYQTITDDRYDKYFYRDGEVQWEDAGGQLLIDQFPLNPNEYWDTDGDGVADNTDQDDDDDGLSDAYELTPKGEWRRTSNPKMKDTDGDGLDDDKDPIPFRKEETKDTDGDWLGDETEDWDDDNDGLDDGFEITTSSVNPDSDGDGYSDGERGLFKTFNSKGNWISTIRFIPTNTVTPSTGYGERYTIRIHGHNNWENEIEISLNTKTRKYSLVDFLNYFKNEINANHSEINYKDWGNDALQAELISATVSGTDLIITGNDQQRNIHISLDWYFAENFIRAQTSDWWFLNKDQFPNDPKEWFDSDRDGIGDNSDDNDDSDSLDDKEELLLGLNPYKGDTDGDRCNDSDDEMPLDPSSRDDMDGDGIPDYRWSDNNNDGRFTLHPGGEDGDPIVVDLDRDGDGILNTNEDPSQGQTHPDNDDTDNDGYKDGDDLFPFNPNAHADFDNDGIADYYDFDDDNDGFSDKDEAYSKTDPNDANKYPEVDVDKDFMSDSYESSAGTNPTVNDSDNDGFNDGIDVFPMDKYEWIDSDADGEGNNRDNNDDNDAVIDYWEKIGITHGYYSGNISTTIWNRDIDLIGADDEDLRDSDNDRVPDLIEKKAAALFKDMFDNGSDQYKRAVWRMHEGINNWDDPDGDNNRNFVLYNANIDNKDDNMRMIMMLMATGQMIKIMLLRV